MYRGYLNRGVRWLLVIFVIGATMASTTVSGGLFLTVFCTAMALGFFLEYLDERIETIYKQNTILNGKLEEIIQHERKFTAFVNAWREQSLTGRDMVIR